MKYQIHKCTRSGNPSLLVSKPERFLGQKKVPVPKKHTQYQHLAEGLSFRGSLTDWHLDTLGTVPITDVAVLDGSLTEIFKLYRSL